MLLWFWATGILAVWFVFRDPGFDFRYLAVGVLLPDIVDGVTGGAWVLHSLIGSVLLMAVVMAMTVGNRPRRKRWLGVPIGTFLHLVFDGAFTMTSVLWWPFTGWSFEGEPLPVVERGWWNVPLELVGLALLVFGWRRFGLRDADQRRHFWRTGQLPQGPRPTGAASC